MHLIVYCSMNGNIISAPFFYIGKTFLDFGAIYKVYTDFYAVISSCLYTFLDSRIRGISHHNGNICASFGSHFHFGSTSIHCLHVCEQRCIRKQFSQMAYRIHSLAFNKRGTNFQPIRTPFNRLPSNLYSPVKVNKIKGYL